MEPQLFSTRLTEMFEVPHPIAAGGMMWLSTAGFIAAVARGGAMGFMTPRSYGAPEAFREGLAECIANLTLENTGSFWHSNGEELPW